MTKGRNSIIISGILAAFVAGLIITVSTADAGIPSDPFNAGDFLCYSATFTIPGSNFALNDQFFEEPQPHSIVEFLGFCASGTKTIPDPLKPGDVLVFDSPFGVDQHMMRWAIQGDSPNVKVELTDQFGSFEHNVLEAREIITPAIKSTFGGLVFPVQLNVHWKCYDIDGDDIDGPVTLRDQFSDSSIPPIEFFTLTPALLCAPATKIIEDPALPGSVITFPPEQDVHLKCYNIDSILVPIGADFRDQFFSVTVLDAETERLCTTVTKSVLSADLSIEKSDNPDPVNPGNQLTYSITVNNAGPTAAQNVVVTDTLPAGVTFVSTTGCAEDPTGVPTCSLGTILAGGFTSYTITVTVNLATFGTLTNTASVTSDTPDPNPSNNTVTEDTTSKPGPPISVPGPPNEPGSPDEPGPPSGVPGPPSGKGPP